jgi:hypothetical protein
MVVSRDFCRDWKSATWDLRSLWLALTTTEATKNATLRIRSNNVKIWPSLVMSQPLAGSPRNENEENSEGYGKGFAGAIG